MTNYALDLPRGPATPALAKASFASTWHIYIILFSFELIIFHKEKIININYFFCNHHLTVTTSVTQKKLKKLAIFEYLKIKIS